MFRSWLIANKWDIQYIEPYAVAEPAIIFPVNQRSMFPHKHGLMNGVAIKTEESTGDKIPQDISYEEQYELAREVERQLQSISKVYENIFLFGAGYAVRNILMTLDGIIDVNKCCIVSDVVSEIGNKIMFGLIINQINICKEGDVIIIPPSNEQNVIYQRIKYLEARGIALIKIGEKI